MLNDKGCAEKFRAALAKAEITTTFDRASPLRDNERCRSRKLGARGDEASGSFRLQGDAAVPRPRRRGLADEAERAAARAFAHVPRAKVRAQVESE